VDGGDSPAGVIRGIDLTDTPPVVHCDRGFVIGHEARRQDFGLSLVIRAAYREPINHPTDPSGSGRWDFLFHGGEAMGTPLKWITIDALFKERDGPNLGNHPWKVIENAEVVIGRDITNHNEFLVYGRKFLEDAAGMGGQGKVRVVGVELDRGTQQLEKLIAVVLKVKGSHDYIAGSQEVTRRRQGESGSPPSVAAAKGARKRTTKD